jgi:hypothetical protein
MTESANKDCVQRPFEELWNRGQIDKVDEFFSIEFSNFGVHQELWARACTRFPCRFLRLASRCRSSGIRGWMPIQRTDGCASASGRSVPISLRGMNVHPINVQFALFGFRDT